MSSEWDRAARSVWLVACFLVLAPAVWAVPTTSFIHTLSSSEIQSRFWESALFEFGETVVIGPGDSMTLSVEFAGTQYLSFTDSGYERVDVGAENATFDGQFTAGGSWTFTGLEGNLSGPPLGYRISNVPVLVALYSFIEPGETARFRGVDLTLAAAPNQTDGSVSLDGFRLYLQAGNVTIGGSPTGMPEPGNVLLLGLALASALSLRRRA